MLRQGPYLIPHNTHASVRISLHFSFFQVAVPVPVDRPYAVPVPRPYPVAVEKHIAVPVDRPVPVPVPHAVPYPVVKQVRLSLEGRSRLQSTLVK